MYAGKDYRRAREQAQANADWTGRPRYLHFYGGAWWVSIAPPGDESETITPRQKTAGA